MKFVKGTNLYSLHLGVKNDQTSEIQWQKIYTGQDEDMVSALRNKNKRETERYHCVEFNIVFQRIYGFEKSNLKNFLTCISYVLTIGWVRLFFHWYPQLRLYATHKKCPLNRATRLLITVRIVHVCITFSWQLVPIVIVMSRIR